ncbi:MAG: hypothetical protein HQK98_03915 [Nitrospirae bacterium]|nr:hypothetical protein [Nitrospirota bacterium]
MKAKNYVLTVLMATSLLISGQHLYANGEPPPPPPGHILVVGSDGTAYAASHAATAQTTATPTTSIVAITSAGDKKSISVAGRVEHLALGLDSSSNAVLAAVAEKRATANGGQSAANTAGDNATTELYLVSLPFSQNATPVSVNLKGINASKPRVVNGNAYIATDVAVNNGTSAGVSSYLYVISLKGAIISQTEY